MKYVYSNSLYTTDAFLIQDEELLTTVRKRYA